METTTRRQTHQLGQIRHGTIVLEDTLSDDELSCEWELLLLDLLGHRLYDLLKTSQIIMIVPPHSRPREFDTLMNGKVDTAICDNDVATFAEGRDDRRDGAERLGVDNGGFCAEERCQVAFKVLVKVCRYGGELRLLVSMRLAEDEEKYD